jgi:hypothetical protein
MFEVWRDLGFRNNFLELFPEKPLREWASRVMRNGRVYSFSQALGLIRLSQMTQAGSVSAEAEALWQLRTRV